MRETCLGRGGRCERLACRDLRRRMRRYLNDEKTNEATLGTHTSSDGVSYTIGSSNSGSLRSAIFARRGTMRITRSSTRTARVVLAPILIPTRFHLTRGGTPRRAPRCRSCRSPSSHRGRRAQARSRRQERRRDGRVAAARERIQGRGGQTTQSRVY
jgi:hypothetical protein